jgi:hypothetical protein
MAMTSGKFLLLMSIVNAALLSWFSLEVWRDDVKFSHRMYCIERGCP